MDCEEIREYFNIYLDGEFGIEESAELEAHIKHCKECQNLIREEKNFRKNISEKLSEIKAPSDTKEVILLKLNSIKPNPFSFKHLLFSRILPAGVVIASIIIIIFIYILFFVEKKTFLHEAIAFHEENINNEIYGTEEDIKNFLKAKAPFPVKIPVSNNPEISLIGTKITKINGALSVLFIYKYRNHKITMIQWPPDQQKDPFISQKNVLNGIYLERMGKYSIANFNKEGINHSIIGDINDREMLNLIPASF